MAKVLSIDDMLEAAGECGLPDYDAHVDAIELAATALAKALGSHLDIKAGDATWEGKAFAGLCAPFYARTADQPCPPCIDKSDPDGDWEGPDCS